MTTALDQLREDKGADDREVRDHEWARGHMRSLGLGNLGFDELMRCVERGTTDCVLDTALQSDAITPEQYGELQVAVRRQERYAREHRPKTRRRS